MTTRRNFLGGLAGIFAAGFAPAAIGPGVLMPTRKIVAPEPVEIWQVGSKQPKIAYHKDSFSLVAPTLNKGDIITFAGLEGQDGRRTQFLVTSVNNGGVVSITPSLYK